MFKETLTEHDDVIGLVCEGKLTEADFKKIALTNGVYGKVLVRVSIRLTY